MAKMTTERYNNIQRENSKKKLEKRRKHDGERKEKRKVRYVKHTQKMKDRIEWLKGKVKEGMDFVNEYDKNIKEIKEKGGETAEQEKVQERIKDVMKNMANEFSASLVVAEKDLARRLS